MNDQEMSELTELLKAQTEGGADDVNLQRLAQILRNDPEAQAFYVEYCQMHAMLAWEHGVLGEVAFDDAPQTVNSVENASSQRSRRRWRLLAIAASVALAVTASWMAYRRLGERVPLLADKSAVAPIGDPLVVDPPVAWEERDAYAVVSRSHGARLSVPDVKRELFVGDQVRSGVYDLIGGFVELTYDNGVVVVVESPAKFRVATELRMRLFRGRLAAKVSPQAEGFTVETPSADVVDYGTEFAIEVTKNKSSEVHVFSGEVDVRPKAPAANDEAVRLLTDQATRINTSSGVPQGIDVDHERFVRDLTEPSHSRVVRSYQPVTFLRMSTSVDGRTLVDRGLVQTPGVVLPGEMIPPPFAPGRIGQALRLGGPDTKAYGVVAEYPIAPDGKLSVCAWVRAESRARWAAIARNFAFESGGQFHFGLYKDDGDLEVQVHDDEQNPVAVREHVPLPIGEWQHVAFVVDGQALRLYRNGKEVASAPCDGLTLIAPRAMGVGAKLNPKGTGPDENNPGFWHGRIDELAIFHDALSATDILGIYESVGKNPSLVDAEN